MWLPVDILYSLIIIHEYILPELTFSIHISTQKLIWVYMSVNGLNGVTSSPALISRLLHLWTDLHHRLWQIKNILTYELQCPVTELMLAQVLRLHAGNGTFTAAGLVEWITLIISPEWISQCYDKHDSNIRL